MDDKHCADNLAKSSDNPAQSADNPATNTKRFHQFKDFTAAEIRMSLAQTFDSMANRLWPDTDDAATKADLTELKAELKTELARLEAGLTWRMTIIAGIIIAAVSLITRLQT